MSVNRNYMVKRGPLQPQILSIKRPSGHDSEHISLSFQITDILTLHISHNSIDSLASISYYTSTPLPSEVMACTRNMTHKPVTIHSASEKTKMQLRSARLRRASIVPRSGLPLTIYFHRVRVDSDTAKKNILRLFFQAGSRPEPFSRQYKHAKDDPETRLSVKLGVCWKLSASSPETYERIYALPQALDSLCMCLHDVIKGENPTTKFQENYTSQLKRQINAIAALPDFITLTSEALYRKFLDIFIPEGSSAREEMLGPLSPISSCYSREEAGVHLNRSFAESGSCYADEYGCSDRHRDAGWLITECLNFRHNEMHPYWIGKALRVIRHRER
jgi:hypothetical protein